MFDKSIQNRILPLMFVVRRGSCSQVPESIAIKHIATQHIATMATLTVTIVPLHSGELSTPMPRGGGGVGEL